MKKMIALFTVSVVACCYGCISAADSKPLIHDIDGVCQLAREYEMTKDPNRLETIYKRCDDLLKNVFSNSTTPHIVVNELLEASRAPSENELPAINNLISFLRSTGIEIAEARYIDMDSTMPKKQMSTKLMAAAMSFVENPDADAIVTDNIPAYYFANKQLKRRLLHDISDICKESRLFRELLVSLILKNKFPHTRNVTKICVPSWRPNRLFFSESEFPGSRGDCIFFSSNFTGIKLQSFFNSRYAEKKTTNDIYATAETTAQVLFHEMAHSWIMDFFRCTDKVKIDKTIELFSKIITGTNFDEDALNSFFARLHTIPKIAQEKYITRFNESYCTKFTTLDAVKKNIFERSQSLEGIAEILFLCPVEIVQIMGLALIKCGDKNVLFINSLSDFALSIELGVSVRNDHTAYAINPENETLKYTFPETLYLSHTINLDFYGAMFQVYGSSIQQYVIKLMYGDSLLPMLKFERNLWKRYSTIPSLKTIMPHFPRQHYAISRYLQYE